MVTRGGGWRAIEAFDGESVYYAKGFISTSVWRVSSSGGPEVKMADSLNLLHNFDVTRHGVYYQVGGLLELRLSLWFLPFTGTKPELITELRRQTAGGMAATPDSVGRRGRIIFAATERRGGDLWMVEGLH